MRRRMCFGAENTEVVQALPPPPHAFLPAVWCGGAREERGAGLLCDALLLFTISCNYGKVSRYHHAFKGIRMLDWCAGAAPGLCPKHCTRMQLSCTVQLPCTSCWLQADFLGDVKSHMAAIWVLHTGTGCRAQSEGLVVFRSKRRTCWL